jgi:hypothetical protein
VGAFLALLGFIALTGLSPASAAKLGGLQVTKMGATTGSLYRSHVNGISLTLSSAWSGSGEVLDSVGLMDRGTTKFRAGDVVRLALIDADGFTFCVVQGTVSSASPSWTIYSATIATSCPGSSIPMVQIAHIAVSVS